jgi:hypothetical protein
LRELQEGKKMRRCGAARVAGQNPSLPGLRLLYDRNDVNPIVYAYILYILDCNHNVKRSKKWFEPQRMDMVKDAKRKGKNTWVSLGMLHDDAARVLFLGLEESNESVNLVV